MAYCFECNNTGYVECDCGGDICVCENYGEDICPVCGGDCCDDDDFLDYDEVTA